jgi:glucose-6-phosphate isomerase
MLRLRFDNVFDTRVGPEGLSAYDYTDGLEKARDAVAAVGAPGFTKLAALREAAVKVKAFAARRRKRCRNFVQIGIGGSALGAIAIQTALRPRWNNESATPRLYCLDNVDPEETAELFDHLDPKETIFHIVTKSGETTETLAGFLIALDRVRRKLKTKWQDHFVVTTDAEKGFLRAWVDREKIASFAVPPDVGGRFSVLTPVGLVPAAFAGIDPLALLDGAAAAQRDLNIATKLALLPFLLDTRQKKRIHVMMPYARALKDLADWHRQIWAESLGKNLTLNGQACVVGPTPVVALGATDQHSQVQLYTEGPNDKFFLLLQVAKFRADIKIPRALDEASLDFLPGRRVGEILEAERMGTEAALTAASRPNATLTLGEISPRSVGAFFQTFAWATAIAGRLYNVNAFDQPGVEAGKKAAFALLDRKGYESQKADVLKQLESDPRFTI